MRVLPRNYRPLTDCTAAGAPVRTCERKRIEESGRRRGGAPCVVVDPGPKSDARASSPSRRRQRDPNALLVPPQPTPCPSPAHDDQHRHDVAPAAPAGRLAPGLPRAALPRPQGRPALQPLVPPARRPPVARRRHVPPGPRPGQDQAGDGPRRARLRPGRGVRVLQLSATHPARHRGRVPPVPARRLVRLDVVRAPLSAASRPRCSRPTRPSTRWRPSRPSRACSSASRGTRSRPSQISSSTRPASRSATSSALCLLCEASIVEDENDSVARSLDALGSWNGDVEWETNLGVGPGGVGQLEVEMAEMLWSWPAERIEDLRRASALVLPSPPCPLKDSSS